MSYRDIRNFLEMLRALGYPSLISMESFRTPNFPLVADLLVWLAKRFDPYAEIPTEISTEEQRIDLIRSAAQFMALKASVKLNTKRLYQADGYAVKELLKITSLLYEALTVNLDDAKDGGYDDDSFNMRDYDISDKVTELKQSRQLASEITATGANLFDLLGKEISLRGSRNKSMAKQFEISDVEGGIKKAIEAVTKEISETKQLIDNVAATEASLDSKIERRKVEIDRYEKRLQTLKKVRPAFLEEFTILEQELEHLFIQYSVRLRCLNQLEKQFSEAERAEIEKELQMTSPRIQTIPLDDTSHDDMFLELEDRGDARPIQKQERPRASTGGRHRAKAYGGMHPPLNGSHSSLDLSTDSESDELFLDKDEPELMHSDEESLALELSGIERKGATSTRKTSSKQVQGDSDDDF